MNLWKIYLIHCARPWVKPQWKGCSWKQRVRIWWFWWSSNWPIFSRKKLIFESRFRRDKRESKSRSIKVLDYAMSGHQGAAICDAFIEIPGLKPLFMAFMNKVRICFPSVLCHWMEHTVIQAFQGRDWACLGRHWAHTRDYFILVDKSSLWFGKSHSGPRKICGSRIRKSRQTPRNSG